VVPPAHYAITSADLLNDRVLPFFEEHQIPLLRILTDRGSEYKGKPEHHEYELYLTIEGIEHSKTQVRHPQTNGICERERHLRTATPNHAGRVLCSSLPEKALQQPGGPARQS